MPPAPTSPAAPPRLEMTGVCKRFGATLALEGVDLHVRAGEVLALVGENGAGKSTLMKILSGAYSPDAGAMWLDGRPYRPSDPLSARRAGVAMIYQELSLAGHLSVEENIVLGVEPTRLGVVRRRAMRERAMEALAVFDHPEIRPGALVRRLSVGAQQLVEIGRALAADARVLVFDEPTSSLNRHDAGQLFALIDKLKARGIAIVYISHFLEEVARVADRVTVLRDGRVAGGGPVRDLAPEQIVAMMVGREVTELYPRSPRTPGEPALEISALSGAPLPLAADLTLHYGEVLGIAGLVGAGRSELLRAVFGLAPVRGGAVRLGAYVGPGSPAARWRQGAGFLSEDRKGEGLATSLSIADNMTLSKLTPLGPGGLVLPSRQRRASERWIERLGIRCRGPEQRAGDLSGGNQQKIAVARLLHHDVDVFLLDEPTRGIDGRRPKAVLMVSSYLPELLGVCDRIAVMCRGRLGPARAVGALDERSLMMEALGQEALA
ncbi:MAG: sugar ABC transporter ATP-binding protein [Planctomycetota bacterium]|nr:sugar ABC transporter ATP-binding protein [Planctomycetota bacterium]